MFIYSTVGSLGSTVSSPVEGPVSSKEGSCHDQVMFELIMLKMIPSCNNCRAWFVFEHDSNGQGGETHSYVTYKQNGKLYWFECRCYG